MALYKVTVQGKGIFYYPVTEYIVAEDIVQAIQEAVRMQHTHTLVSHVDSAELIAKSVQIAVIADENT